VSSFSIFPLDFLLNFRRTHSVAMDFLKKKMKELLDDDEPKKEKKEDKPAGIACPFVTAFLC